MTKKDIIFNLCKKHLKDIEEETGERYKEKYTVKIVPTRDCELCKKKREE